jgi:membrane protease YdiL (CAAX protease family)
MKVQTANIKLVDEVKTQTHWLQRLGLFFLFMVCEAAIFIFGSHYFKVFPTNMNLAFNLVVSAVLLAAAMGLKYDKRWNTHGQIAFVFFIASIAYPFTALFDSWIRMVLSWFAVTTDTSKGMAIEKVCEMLLKVVPILLLVKLAGADMGSIFLKRGNLKLGLGIGALVFFFLSPAAFMFAAQRFTSVDTLIAAVVWGIVFSAANGFMEELWLRGIFLKRFAPVLGINASVWLTSIIFAFMHGFAFYFNPMVLAFFVVNTLALGLACGYLMIQSDSIWGAVLIHAASDFFLFVAVLESA